MGNKVGFRGGVDCCSAASEERKLLGGQGQKVARVVREDSVSPEGHTQEHHTQKESQRNLASRKKGARGKFTAWGQE